jgi:nicotinamide riboside kinase
VLFGGCPDAVGRQAARRKYDLYLLLDIDVPWIDDAQRYLPHQRQVFFDRCRAILDEQSRPYVVLSGGFPKRFEQACRAVDGLLSGNRSTGG